VEWVWIVTGATASQRILYCYLFRLCSQ